MRLHLLVIVIVQNSIIHGINKILTVGRITTAPLLYFAMRQPGPWRLLFIAFTVDMPQSNRFFRTTATCLPQRNDVV